jgi:hypothetical protein
MTSTFFMVYAFSFFAASSVLMSALIGCSSIRALAVFAARLISTGAFPVFTTRLCIFTAVISRLVALLMSTTKS